MLKINRKFKKEHELTKGLGARLKLLRKRGLYRRKTKFKRCSYKRLKVVSRKPMDWRKHVSKNRIAYFFGFSFQRYSSYENGTIPPLHVLIAFSKLYKVSLDYLVGLSPVDQPDYCNYNRQLEQCGIDSVFLEAIKALKLNDPKPDGESLLTLLKILAVHQSAEHMEYGLLRLIQMLIFNTFDNNKVISIADNGDITVDEKPSPSFEYTRDIAHLPSEDFIVKALLQSINDELLRLRKTHYQKPKEDCEEQNSSLQSEEIPLSKEQTLKKRMEELKRQQIPRHIEK